MLQAKEAFGICSLFPLPFASPSFTSPPYSSGFPPTIFNAHINATDQLAHNTNPVKATRISKDGHTSGLLPYCPNVGTSCIQGNLRANIQASS